MYYLLHYRVKHVHIKDARRSHLMEQWGKEVPWGERDIDNDYDNLKCVDYQGALAIEREAGSKRIEDIQNTATALQQFTD